MEKGKKVGVLLIGAQKAGTTSLYRYMGQHPDIVFSRVKEITYFIDEEHYARGEGYYHEFFPATVGNRVVASSHVHMLASEAAPERVRKYNPGMRFVVLLRHPSERAWSAYNYAKRNGWEKDDIDIMAALQLERSRLGSSSHRDWRDLAYGFNGLYASHLSRWLEFFPREQFLILRTVDLNTDPKSCLEQVWKFLSLRNDVTIDVSRQYNRAGRARWPWINKLLFDRDSSLKAGLRKIFPVRTRVWFRSVVVPQLKRMNSVDARSDPLADDVREWLDAYFRDDLAALDERFGIRL